MLERLLPAISLSLLATACLSPPPKARIETPDVVVLANDPERARALAEEAAGHLEWMRAEVPELRDARPEIWLVDEISPFRWFPVNEYTDGLHFRFLWIRRLYVRDDAEPGTVAHELGHFLLGGPWRGLPPFVEEGMCDWLMLHSPIGYDGERRTLLRWIAALGFGGKIVMESEPVESIRTQWTLDFRAKVPTIDEVSRYGSWRLLDGTFEERLVAFGYGMVVVERGMERLDWDGWLELCRGASRAGVRFVPAEDMWRALGVKDGAELGREHLRSLDATELAALVSELFRSGAYDVLASGSGVPRGGPELLAWIDEHGLVARVPGGSAEVRVADVPTVREVLGGEPAK